MENKKNTHRTAVVMLACKDYRAMELALACHMAYRPLNIPFFVLQNCRGGYDAERTYEVGLRYAQLFPNVVKVVDWLPPGPAYRTISSLLESPELSGFDLICKVDDDAFPIAPGWLDRMLNVWDLSNGTNSEKLAYVTPLINNNCWGFSETLDVMGLTKDYFREQAHIHYAGGDNEVGQLRIVPKDQILTGRRGTIWGYPHIARWIHERTTFKPDEFILATHGLSPIDVPSKERYSIGCILFRPALWKKIDDGVSSDDEGMMHMFCAKNELRIVCARDVPFIHLAYFTQREENRDITDRAQVFYESRLGHPFPIALYPDRILDIETRIRMLETEIRLQLPITDTQGRSLNPKIFFTRVITRVMRRLRRILRLN